MPKSRLRRAVLSWSGGKDSAWALERVRDEVDIIALITTVEERSGRVPIHEIRGELIQAQADSVGIPLWTVPLPHPCSNRDYVAKLGTMYAQARSAGAQEILFGDLFLADIRKFREDSLAGSGLTPVFPLWQIPTATLAKEIVAGGLRAILTSVDRKRLAADYAGGLFGSIDMPADVDPCGENGEFHTFVFDGPMFREPIRTTIESRREDDRYAYAESAAMPRSPCPELSL